MFHRTYNLNNIPFYDIDAQVHKTEDWMLKQRSWSMVYMNRQDMCSDSPNRMMPLAGSGLKTEGDYLKIWKVAALLVVMPAYHLIMEMYVLETNKLKTPPQECQH